MRPRHARLVLLALAASLAGAAPAAAGTLTITYEIQSGSTDCCKGLVEAPDLVGQFSLAVPALGPGTLVSGEATIVSLAAVAATPTLDVGLSLVSPVEGVAFRASGSIGYIIDFGVPGPISFRSGRAFTRGPEGLGNVALYASALGLPTATLRWTLCCYYSTAGPTFLEPHVLAVGQEVSRTFVPEPRVSHLLGTSAVLVAAGIAVRRARRSRRS